jgi:pentatricopeptide repeat protein
MVYKKKKMVLQDKNCNEVSTNRWQSLKPAAKPESRSVNPPRVAILRRDNFTNDNGKTSQLVPLSKHFPFEVYQDKKDDNTIINEMLSAPWADVVKKSTTAWASKSIWAYPTESRYAFAQDSKIEATKESQPFDNSVDDGLDVVTLEAELEDLWLDEGVDIEPRRLKFDTTDHQNGMSSLQLALIESSKTAKTPNTFANDGMSSLQKALEESKQSAMSRGVDDVQQPKDVQPSKETFDITDLLPPKQLTRFEYIEEITGYAESSKFNDGAERAECILRYMIQQNELGVSHVRPDGGCYNKVMYAYAKAAQPNKAEEVMNFMCEQYDRGDDLAEPNVRHYTTLIFAWQKSSEPNAPERCQQILQTMHDLYESGHLANCRPDAYTYTAVLHCWANSTRPDAAIKAEKLFRVMKDRVHAGDKGLTPDCVTYSNLINAIINSPGYARAEDILWEMVDDFLQGNDICKPRIRTLNTVLAVWSKENNAAYAPVRAEEMVNRWLRLNKTTELDVKPDKYTYCLLLKAW